MKTINKHILPGLILSVVIAVLAKYLANFIPSIGAASLAICIGIVLGNTICRKKSLNKGTKFSESQLLEYSVALLGLTVTFQTIARLGFAGLIYVVIIMTSIILFTVFLGKKLGFKDEIVLMIAGGNAVCGSSAIGAIAPAICDEEDSENNKDKGQSIVLINLLGTILMFVIPLLGVKVFGFTDLANSAFTGGILQSVGQVVASASLINETVTQYAMLFKITRILFLVVVVFAFEKWMLKKSDVDTTFATTDSAKKSKLKSIPWYILVFLAFCLINSCVSLPDAIGSTSKLISGWFEITALAAIGLRLDFKKFLHEGPRFLIYMVLIGLFQIGISVLLIFVFNIR